MKKPELIKICGLSTKDSVDAVIAGGATHMGLIFFEKSPRYVTLDQARELSNHAGDRISKVAVTVNADDAYLQEIHSAVAPDFLQFHGNESPEVVLEANKRFGLPIIKALSIETRSDLDKAYAYRDCAEFLLLDAKPPKDSEVPGGNGVAFNWEIMDGWHGDMPYILSGGLNRANIDEALARSGASRIDVSSGVETAPGIKDPGLIREFLGHFH